MKTKLSVPQKLKPFIPWLALLGLMVVTWVWRLPWWLHFPLFILALIGTAYAAYRNRDELGILIEKAKKF